MSSRHSDDNESKRDRQSTNTSFLKNKTLKAKNFEKLNKVDEADEIVDIESLNKHITEIDDNVNN